MKLLIVEREEEGEEEQKSMRRYYECELMNIYDKIFAYRLITRYFVQSSLFYLTSLKHLTRII